MPERKPIVFVVDDDKSIRDAIACLLGSVGLEARCYASAQDFLRDARDTRDTTDGTGERPACLVLDVRMPGMNGLELQRELELKQQPIPIIFISAHLDMPQTVRALKAGAVEFLLKPFRDQELLDAIHSAIKQAREASRENAEASELRARFDQLSPRERQVFELVVEGLLNKQIADELGISEVTVKIHRAKVRQKMEAGSLPELVRMASRLADLQPQAAVMLPAPRSPR
jgi:RNA polymerase sigma factor (sigma-70 family)